jgi:hypothetical protein
MKTIDEEIREYTKDKEIQSILEDFLKKSNWLKITFLKERLTSLKQADIFGLEHMIKHYEKLIKKLEDES